MPEDEYDAYLCADIAELASEYGSQLVFYDRANTSALTHGDVTVNIAKEAKLSRSESALTVFTLEYGDTVTAYVGASAWEDAEAWGFVNGAKYMIFGSCGPMVKCAPDGKVSDATETICLSDGTLAQTLLSWLDGFEGVIMAGTRLSFALK